VRVAIVITALVLGVILAVDACAQCLPVDESVVTLTGQVILRTYPGPPNYEDIKRGDRAESHLFSFYRRPSAHIGRAVTGMPLHGTMSWRSPWSQVTRCRGFETLVKSSQCRAACSRHIRRTIERNYSLRSAVQACRLTHERTGTCFTA